MSNRLANPNKLRMLGATTALLLGATACGGTAQTGAETPHASPSATSSPTGSGKRPAHYPVGYDVSWAQCGEALPTSGDFGIIQITYGRANVLSPEACFKQQIDWAKGLSGQARQPKVQFYLWPANPGKVYRGQKITDWPTSCRNQYGSCTNGSGPANSFQYGLERGRTDLAYAAKTYGSQELGTVYIDVESGIGNNPGTWQANSKNNLAAIEGFAAAIREAGDTPGLYSDANQLSQVLDGQDAAKLAGLPEWISGGGTVEGARQNCSAPFIAGAKVLISQYVQGPYPSTARSPINLDYAC